MENAVLILKKPIKFRGGEYSRVKLRLVTVGEELDALREADQNTMLYAANCVKSSIVSISDSEGKSIPKDEIDVDLIASINTVDYEAIHKAIDILKKSLEMGIELS